VDAVAVRGALTYFTPNPVLLLQGVLVITLFAIVVAASVSSEGLSLWSVGGGSFALIITYYLHRRCISSRAI
jgi:cation:H+ antiporter